VNGSYVRVHRATDQPPINIIGTVPKVASHRGTGDSGVMELIDKLMKIKPEKVS
jgi:hypothetical protein